MSNRVITINRMFGSNGRIIGKALAEELGFKFYDKELIELAAKECGFSPDFIKANEQRSAFGFFANLASQGFSYSKDTLPEIPRKLSIARKLIDWWLENN